MKKGFKTRWEFAAQDGVIEAAQTLTDIGGAAHMQSLREPCWGRDGVAREKEGHGQSSRVTRLQTGDKMVMVAHQNPGMHTPTSMRASLPECPQEKLPVVIIAP